MTNSDEMILEDPPSMEGEAILAHALHTRVPIVAILGQKIGWRGENIDLILQRALSKLLKTGDSWKSLLSRDALPQSFYEWLGERFLNGAPSQELLTIADSALSAVYTSSIDPRLLNIFTTGGRQPEAVLVGDPPPPMLRSRRRLPVYYLFGRAGAGIGDFVPPSSSQMLSQRRLRHASAMLKTINETATPLGLIVVDGYRPTKDWLRGEDLLAVLGSAPVRGVLWCGQDPIFADDDADTYEALINDGVIIRDQRSLGEIFATLRVGSDTNWQDIWDEPGVVSLSDDKKLITTPGLRLSTQASATIIDDSWTGYLQPMSSDAERFAFAAFHAVPAGPLGLIDGLRRGFAIGRNFEGQLRKRVGRAVAQHHEERGAIVLHGQSGVGKTIALGRLALSIRSTRSAAVLFSYNKFLQAADVIDFLVEVEKIGGVTVLIIDAMASYQRYDDLLQAFRSRGHRVVIVASSYKIGPKLQIDRGRFIEAPTDLTKVEREDLITLSQQYGAGERSRFAAVANQPHALARFFWELPTSRTRLSEGLSKEARMVEATIGARGASKRPIKTLGNLGVALIGAGYNQPAAPLIADVENTEPGIDTSAGRVIDYVMATSRLYKWIPVNLLLRAVLSDGIVGDSTNSIELVREIFGGQDLFRWRFADEKGEELLVGARLQIEAELICNRRLGGPEGEATRLIQLIKSAVRAGSDNNEETRFLTDLVYALGPDGPFKDRYKASYAAIARALTDLRLQNGVLNARLMLQEATLRRHHVRTHSLDPDQKAILLDEARAVIDEALQALDRSSGRRMYASRRTKDNLWVERAATYGYLATDSARRGASLTEVWSSYKAAREAVRMATGRVDTYFPLDFSLWLPADILREAGHLVGSTERLELEADIRSTLDQIDIEFLDPTQIELFQRQRLRVAEVLDDAPLTEEAFAALMAAGSAAGYYLRARALAPKRPETGEIASIDDQSAARRTADYLWGLYDFISNDTRCLTLLLSCEWVSITSRWIFRGQRQPLPFRAEDRNRLRTISFSLLSSAPNEVQARYRYLDAVLNWLTNDETGARESFRVLASETEYVERGRVINRHVITDETGQPIIFSGIVNKKIADGRWSLFVEKLARSIDFVEPESVKFEIAVGRTIHQFAVAFNYLGPIADLHLGRSRRL